MPTSKPRITITLPDSDYATIASLSTLQGVSMSSIVTDLIEAAMPALERLDAVLYHADSASENFLADFHHAIVTSEDEIAQDIAATRSKQLSIDVEAAGGMRSRSPAGSAAVVAPQPAKRPRPPTSNRGVRITSPRSKIETISPMKTSIKPRKKSKGAPK